MHKIIARSINSIVCRRRGLWEPLPRLGPRKLSAPSPRCSEHLPSPRLSQAESLHHDNVDVAVLRRFRAGGASVHGPSRSGGRAAREARSWLSQQPVWEKLCQEAASAHEDQLRVGLDTHSSHSTMSAKTSILAFAALELGVVFPLPLPIGGCQAPATQASHAKLWICGASDNRP